MGTRATRPEPLVPAPPNVAIVPPSSPSSDGDAPAEAVRRIDEYAHPAIHARAVHGGAWKILSSWARAS